MELYPGVSAVCHVDGKIVVRLGVDILYRVSLVDLRVPSFLVFIPVCFEGNAA